MSANLQERSLIYEGSVKRVFLSRDEGAGEGPGAPRMWFEYTDDYSVFDWGKMPDTIQNKGRALAIMGAYFFEKLKAPSHYVGLVKSSGSKISLKEAATTPGAVFLEVLPAEVERPEPFVLIAQTVYYYPRRPSKAKRRLVPLEVVFRFGMPSGSSLKARLDKDPNYASVLGLSSIPKPGEWFERPVLEFFTKLEPKDRLLTIQEALLISNLTPEQFQELIDLSLKLCTDLFKLFKDKGIELWDGKFEFAIGEEGLMLVDSIGPDELRLIYKGVHLSKEMIRQVYRGSDWEKSIKEAQDIARQSGKHDWKEICINKLNQKPDPLPADFKQIVDQLYGSLTNHLVGEQLFANQPTLDEFVEKCTKR